MLRHGVVQAVMQMFEGEGGLEGKPDQMANGFKVLQRKVDKVADQLRVCARLYRKRAPPTSPDQDMELEQVRLEVVQAIQVLYEEAPTPGTVFDRDRWSDGDWASCGACPVRQ